MSAVSVIGLKEVLRAVGQVGKQARFAMAKAINKTAMEVQEETAKRILPRVFELRGRGRRWYEKGNKLGFNIRPWARKDRLEAKVASQAPWLGLHEQGGTKRRSGLLAIPQKELKGKSELVRRAIRPKRIAEKLGKQKRLKVKGGSARPLTRNGKLITRMPSGQRGLFVRLASGRVRALYLLESQARIRKRLSWRRESEKVVDRVLPKRFASEFVKAMKTAR